MPKFVINKGEEDVILTVFIRDSSQTDGSGLGSLDHTSSIAGAYSKRDGLGIALAVDENVTTEGTYEAPSAAGKVRIGTPANHITGTYELHFHNDLFTTADWVTITLGGASDMATLLIEVQLTDVDLNTALSSSTIGTCTTNTDMRGTDGANTTTPDAAGTASSLHSTTDGKIDGLNNLSAADVNAECDTALSDYDVPTKTEMDNKIDALNNLASGDITTACTSSLNTYDPPTKAELDAALDTGVNVIKVEGVTLGAKAGDNFNVFFNNAGEDSVQTQDDVGGGATAFDPDTAVIISGFTWTEFMQLLSAKMIGEREMKKDSSDR